MGNTGAKRVFEEDHISDRENVADIKSFIKLVYKQALLNGIAESELTSLGKISKLVIELDYIQEELHDRLIDKPVYNVFVVGERGPEEWDYSIQFPQGSWFFKTITVDWMKAGQKEVSIDITKWL